MLMANSTSGKPIDQNRQANNTLLTDLKRRQTCQGAQMTSGLRWLPPLLAAATVLNGCAGAAISSGTFAVKASVRDGLDEPAAQGDAEAQYRLGKSWCCMGPGFDTQTATQWLCRAARQGHAEALFELGRIYDGEISRTPAPGQKIMRMINAKSSPPHALAFFGLAADAGHEDAAARRKILEQAASVDTRRQAEALRADFAGSCEYQAVFPEGS